MGQLIKKKSKLTVPVFYQAYPNTVVNGYGGIDPPNYVKTGKVDIRYGAFLARMMQLRQKADYNCFYDITEEEISEIRPLAEGLVKVIIHLFLLVQK